jgi:hypothetical protein
MRTDHLSAFALEIAASSAATNDKPNLFATSTFINNAAFMNTVYSLVDAAVSALSPSVVGLVFTATFQPLPYAIYSKSSSSGGNVLGLDDETDDFINILTTVAWQLLVDNAKVYAAVEKLFKDIEAAAKAQGLWNEFVYLNYAAQWQKPLSGYGAENKEFLESISQLVDPGQLFQVGVPGGFKVATG